MEKEYLIELVKKSQSGNEQSIEELLCYAHTSVSYQCRKMLRHTQDAEDVTQEVLVTIYTKLDSLQDPAAFNKWVNKITATRCINVLNRSHVEYQFAEDEDGHSVLDNLEELDEQTIPDKALDNAETARMIEEIVEELPDAQRACTLMFYYGEMSVKAIAQTMQVSENTIKSRLNYARKAIKDKVLDYEKQGIKLYGISPLPFLLYFLRLSAQTSADKESAEVMVAKIMAADAAGIAGACASGTGGAAAAASTAATGGGATAAGGAATFLSGGISAKVIVGVLAGMIAIGGITAGMIATAGKNSGKNTLAETVAVYETEHVIPETEVPVTEAATEPAGTEPAAAQTEPVVPAAPTEHTHSYVNTVTTPTCTANGYTTFTCSCGDAYQDHIVNATGHSLTVMESVNPTCTADGYTVSECSICGYVEKATVPTSDSLHSYYISDKTTASCEVAGEVTYTCAVCGKNSTVAKSIKAHTLVFDHLFFVCGETASEIYSCSTDYCEMGFNMVDVEPPYSEHIFDENGMCIQCGVTRTA